MGVRVDAARDDEFVRAVDGLGVGLGGRERADLLDTAV